MLEHHLAPCNFRHRNAMHSFFTGHRVNRLAILLLLNAITGYLHNGRSRLEYYLSSILPKDYQKSLKVLFMGEIYRLVSKVYSHLVI